MKSGAIYNNINNLEFLKIQNILNQLVFKYSEDLFPISNPISFSQKKITSNILDTYEEYMDFKDVNFNTYVRMKCITFVSYNILKEIKAILENESSIHIQEDIEMLYSDYRRLMKESKQIQDISVLITLAQEIIETIELIRILDGKNNFNTLEFSLIFDHFKYCVEKLDRLRFCYLGGRYSEYRSKE